MKHEAVSSKTTSRARDLRRNASPVERKFWYALRHAFPQVHFRRQVPLGLYFADFACHSHKLVIELDGNSHAHTQLYDNARTHFIEGEGYHVMRFANTDVTRNLEGILVMIATYLDSTPTPNPSPQGRGEFQGIQS